MAAGAVMTMEIAVAVGAVKEQQMGVPILAYFRR